MKLFIGNNKGNFIKETKKLITDIKKYIFNLSTKAFDENAIDAYANVIWKNFPLFCTYFLRLEINQQINVALNIKDNEWFFRDNKLFQVIGEQTEFEKDRKKICWKRQKKRNNKLWNKKCDKNENNKYNLVEKSTSTKIKIRINKITLTKIKLLFLLQNKKVYLLEN